MVVSTSGSLGRRSVGDAVTRAGVEAKQLGADSLVLKDTYFFNLKLPPLKISYLEAGAGASVLPALGVKGEQLAGENPGQRLLFMGRVVHTRRRLSAEKSRILSSCHHDDLTSSLCTGCPPKKRSLF